MFTEIMIESERSIYAVLCVSAATSVFYFFLNEYGLNGPNTKEG